MTVWGFVGPSGTGKSHRALELASRSGVDCVIDDGLLIREGRVLAGISAKREPSKLASVRRAMFMDESHAEQVKAAIKTDRVRSILILGTSGRMTDGIASRLDLPAIARYVYISEVATPEEIASALNMRRQQGKHVIPAPTMAIKKQFSGVLLDPLLDPIKRLARIGLRQTKPGTRGAQDVKDNRAVVRPTFSYMGSYTIARQAVEQIAATTLSRVDGVARVIEVKVADEQDAGIRVEASVAVSYGRKIHIVLETASARLREEIDWQTALNVLSVTVMAKALVGAGGK